MKRKQKRRKINSYKKRVAALERKLQKQSLEIEIILSFCKAVAFHDKKGDLISYKMANCPLSDECEKFLMLFEKHRELS